MNSVLGADWSAAQDMHLQCCYVMVQYIQNVTTTPSILLQEALELHDLESAETPPDQPFMG